MADCRSSVLGTLKTRATLPPPDTCSGGAEGIYLFAFTPTGTFLGSTELTAYSDIRRWVYTNGQLYAGVQAQDKTGRVLHWIGNTQNPFLFEEVAAIESDVAYITALGDQLYATTWAAGFSPNLLACAADLVVDYANVLLRSLGQPAQACR